jgi:hypothetical protein
MSDVFRGLILRQVQDDRLLFFVGFLGETRNPKKFFLRSPGVCDNS